DRRKFPLNKRVSDRAVEDGIALLNADYRDVTALADLRFRAHRHLGIVFQVVPDVIGNHGIHASLQTRQYELGLHLETGCSAGSGSDFLNGFRPAFPSCTFRLRRLTYSHLSADVFTEGWFGKQLRNLAADDIHGRRITAGTSSIPAFNKRHERLAVFGGYMGNLCGGTAVT